MVPDNPPLYNHLGKRFSIGKDPSDCTPRIKCKIFAKFQFLVKISVLGENFDFLAKTSTFGQNFDSWSKFRFLIKISVLS